MTLAHPWKALRALSGVHPEDAVDRTGLEVELDQDLLQIADSLTFGIPRSSVGSAIGVSSWVRRGMRNGLRCWCAADRVVDACPLCVSEHTPALARPGAAQSRNFAREGTSGRCMNLRTRDRDGLCSDRHPHAPGGRIRRAARERDDRATPTALGSLPAQAAGTTVEATRLPNDPYSSCGPEGGQVWYRFTAPADGPVAVRVRADGDLDERRRGISASARRPRSSPATRLTPRASARSTSRSPRTPST